MPNYKVLVRFKVGIQGWAESYYFNAATPENVRPRALALCAARGGMLASGVTIPYVSISDDAISGDVIEFTNPAFTPVGGLGNPQPSDFAWTGLLVRMRATQIYGRTMILRGIPDPGIEGPNTSQPLPAALLERFNAFRDLLKNDQWRMRGLNRSDAGFNKSILSISVDVPAKTANINVTGHGWAIGNTINITKLNTYKSLRGRQLIVAVPGPNDVQFKWTAEPTPGPDPYNGKGKARLVEPIYPEISTTTYIRITKRDTGRPFGLSRGRAGKRIK